MGIYRFLSKDAINNKSPRRSRGRLIKKSIAQPVKKNNGRREWRIYIPPVACTLVALVSIFDDLIICFAFFHRTALIDREIEKKTKTARIISWMERKSTVPELIHRGSKKTIPKKSRQVGLYFRPMESINGTRRGKSTGRKKNKKNATVATNQLCSLFRSGMHI